MVAQEPVAVEGDRHPGQQLRFVQLPRTGDHLVQQPSRLGPLPHVPELPGEVEADERGPPQVRFPPRALGGVGGAGGDGEGAAVVADGLFIGQASRGVAGGLQQQVDPPAGLQRPAGEVGVPGEGAGPQRVAEAAVRVQGPYGGGVAVTDLGDVQRGVQRLAQQVVGEGELSGGPGDEDAGHDGRLQQPVHVRDRRAVDHGQDLATELAAEQGGAGQQGDDRIGQQGEPLPDRFAHARRDGGDRGAAVPEPGGLLDEEGVAAGAPVDFVDQLRGGLAARRHRHQRAHLVPAEPGQGERRGGARDQRQDQRLERVSGALHLDVPVGADQQQPLEPGVLGDEFEQAEGGRVGAVQIVEDDHQGAALGEGDEGRGHRVEQAEGVGAVDGTAAGGAGRPRRARSSGGPGGAGRTGGGGRAGRARGAGGAGRNGGAGGVGRARRSRWLRRP